MSKSVSISNYDTDLLKKYQKYRISKVRESKDIDIANQDLIVKNIQSESIADQLHYALMQLVLDYGL